jgi:hypothetical protein
MLGLNILSSSLEGKRARGLLVSASAGFLKERWDGRQQMCTLCVEYWVVWPSMFMNMSLSSL